MGKKVERIQERERERKEREKREGGERDKGMREIKQRTQVIGV